MQIDERTVLPVARLKPLSLAEERFHSPLLRGQEPSPAFPALQGKGQHSLLLARPIPSPGGWLPGLVCWAQQRPVGIFHPSVTETASGLSSGSFQLEFLTEKKTTVGIAPKHSRMHGCKNVAYSFGSSFYVSFSHILIETIDRRGRKKKKEKPNNIEKRRGVLGLNRAFSFRSRLAIAT